MSTILGTAATVLAISAGALAVWFIVRLVNRRVSENVTVFTFCLFASLLIASFILSAAIQTIKEDEGRREYYSDGANVYDLPNDDTQDGK